MTSIGTKLHEACWQEYRVVLNATRYPHWLASSVDVQMTAPQVRAKIRDLNQYFEVPIPRVKVSKRKANASYFPADAGPARIVIGRVALNYHSVVHEFAHHLHQLTPTGRRKSGRGHSHGPDFVSALDRIIARERRWLASRGQS